MIGNRLNSHSKASPRLDRYKDGIRLENEKIVDLKAKRMRIVKKPLFNHTKESCMFCRHAYYNENDEISEDWFSYLCIECMKDYAKNGALSLKKICSHYGSRRKRK